MSEFDEHESATDTMDTDIVDDPESNAMQNDDNNDVDDQEQITAQAAQHEHDNAEEGDAMETAVQDEPSDTTLVAVDAATVIHSTATSTTATSKSAVRHAMNGWMIFSQETREQVLRENPGMAFTEVAKLLSERYRNLSAEEKERLDGLAKADKARYMREMTEVREYEAIHGKGSGSGDMSNGSSGDNAAKTTGLVIPVSRVRKIIKMDKDVKNISKEAMAAITKTTELFVAYMGVRCAGTASLRGARTIRGQDVAATIHSQNAFDFLRLDFPKMPKKPTAKQTSSSSTTDKKAVVSSHSKVTTGTSSIKNFFASTTTAAAGNAAAHGAQASVSEAEAAVDENVSNDSARPQNGDDVKL